MEVPSCAPPGCNGSPPCRNLESRSFGVRTDPVNFLVQPPLRLVTFTGNVATVKQKTITRRWEVATRASRDLGRSFTLTLDLIFLDQTRKNPAALNAPAQFQEFTAILGLRYAFDPVRLSIPGV